MAFHCLIIVTMASQVVSIVLLVCIFSGVDASQDVGCNETCVYTAWALDANCRNRELTQVPHECSSSEMVDLRNNRLTHLGAGCFAGYQELRYLDLEFNVISNVTRGAFGGCVSLENIYLQYNSLTGVGQGAFEGASNLEKLFLNQNSITDIHPDAFQGLARLNGLYIGHNEITRLHASVFQHTPLLKFLHMGNNGLTEFPTGIFDTLTELIYINAENNHLKVLDGSILKNLVNLEKLYLSGNSIFSITGFPTLPNLMVLDLFDNKLQNVNSLVDKIHGLDELYLAENNLTCTCSVDPIREWVSDHMTDEDIDTLRVNVKCGWPQKLSGYSLANLTRPSLCPQPHPGIVGFAGAPSVSPSIQTTTSVQSTTTRGYNHPLVKQNTKQNSEHNPIITYTGVGVATFLTVFVLLIALIKYLDYRSQQHQQEVKQQQPAQQQQQQQQQRPPVVHIIPNRLIQDDDGAYEPVRIRPHSPSDSAFGSQDDVLAAEEQQSWLEPTYRVPPCGSDDTHDMQHPNTPYMTMEQWNALQVLQHAPLIVDNFTSNEEHRPLARQRPNTNPFITPMPEDRVSPNTKSPHQMSTGPLYLSHQVSTPSEPDTMPSQQEDSTGRTPDQTLEHIPRHINAPKAMRYSSKNPFQNSLSRNPFINQV